MEFLLLKILKLQPSELDCMEFYRAEILIENLKEHTEKESEQNKKEQKDYEKSVPSADPSSLMRSAQKSLPSFSSLSSFKSPSLSNFKL